MAKGQWNVAVFPATFAQLVSWLIIASGRLVAAEGTVENPVAERPLATAVTMNNPPAAVCHIDPPSRATDLCRLLAKRIWIPTLLNENVADAARP